MRIGVDLGGTKIEGLLLSEAGEVLERRRVATPSDEGYERVLDAVGELIGDLHGEAGEACRTGIGIPGCIDAHTGLVKNSNSTGLIGKPLKQDLEARLGLEVRVANDANCFAAAEALHGAAKGKAVVFGVILGTGVGGGLAIEGVAREGLHGIAGEWGHSPLAAPPGDDTPTRTCYCGQTGCVETRLSGPGFERDYARRRGEAATAAEILDRAGRGEDAATWALDRYLAFFGEAIARVIHVTDPDAIVLGGGMSNNPHLYDRGREAVAAVLFNDRLETPILRNRLGDSAGVFGAAWLWGPTPLRTPESADGG